MINEINVFFIISPCFSPLKLSDSGNSDKNREPEMKMLTREAEILIYFGIIRYNHCSLQNKLLNKLLIDHRSEGTS